MGYGHRPGNPQIKTFWPDDTDTDLFFVGDVSLSAIIEIVNNEWPETDIKDIMISSEYIHTDCLTYDLYDPSDYTEFVVVTRAPQND